MVRLAALLVALAALAASPALALDKVSFGLNWVPEAEHCGFFQAKATGLYEQAGLDVELRPGNPNVNMPLLVASGELGEVHTVESRFEPWKLENRVGWKRRATAAELIDTLSAP